jgi:hypothetical protein
MSQRVRFLSKGLTILLLGIWAAAVPLALAQVVKDPQWLHDLDLKCRKSTEPEFTKDTRVFGIEVFKDPNNGNAVYISEVGAVAALPGYQDAPAPTPDSKPPKWIYGLDLKCRPAGVKEFKDAKVFSLEVYRDENNGNWVYICETGSIAVVPGKKDDIKAIPEPKAPEWLHDLDLRCRKGNVEKDFTKDTKSFGIEVFKDPNNGNLLYISQTGFLAALPGFQSAPAPTPEAKVPEFLYGLALKCRKVGEKNFTKDTRFFGIEVYRDENNANYVLISEEGALAVAPGAKDIKAPVEKPKDPTWSHGLDLKCRKGREAQFTKDTKVYSMEFHRDENSGMGLYVTQTGAITLVPK